MNKWVILASLFITSIIAIWAILLNVSSIKECPAKLSLDYYACTSDNDCIFHPKYECMNNSKTLNCIISEDLGAKQLAGRILKCKCINNQCITTGLN